MYTPEEVEVMVARWSSDPTKETINELAELLKRSPKSIIGKLSKEGVYKKQEYISKTGEPPVTKKELVAKIAELTKAELVKLEGLEKAPKSTLKYLIITLSK